jgi:transcriptional regulator with XRE-family HTH domain
MYCVSVETLGERIKRVRVLRGLSASELAFKAGIGENAIYKIESGLSKQPSFVAGVRIATALGVTAETLLNGTDVITTADDEPLTPFVRDDRLQELAGTVSGIATQLADDRRDMRELLLVLQAAGIDLPQQLRERIALARG